MGRVLIYRDILLEAGHEILATMKRRSRLRLVLEGLEGGLVLGTALCTWPLSKCRLENWGARTTEREREWAGDRLVSANQDPLTRAIAISAPAPNVWKWLVQFGLGKAGFYSYELLERLVGIPVTNLESIEPSMQSLEVGEEVLLHPRAGIRVSLLEPERCICFGPSDEERRTSEPGTVLRSWSVYIEPTGSDSCRLVVRSCFEHRGRLPLLKRVAALLEAPVDFAMEQRMLRTIKRLAEEAHSQT